ncbi:MAG: hypothetical protein OXE77_11940 [Flavobacteriaceae bacterium]|nr:hypothetical protein [Flavobacteriaceae bacterium]MCY4267764.1 hypothetical protein [Flavobacteriaceae bacterium]MCY4299414.1 hypothetical protein [Flavobacteriaceae bacterium]
MKRPSVADDSLRGAMIKKSVDKVSELVARIKDYDVLLEDWMTQDALIKNIELIGEYVYKMTDEVKHAFPKIP